MPSSFPRYLLAKQTVDDRALNKDVLAALKSHLPQETLSVIEVGAGIGTMLTRLLRWGILPPFVDYTSLDSNPENITFAQTWLPQWAGEHGYQVEQPSASTIRLSVPQSVTPSAHIRSSASKSAPASVTIHILCADLFDYIRSAPTPADLLIAHAFLDLLPLPESLPELLSLTKNLAWLTLNFDGMTTFAPALNPELDSAIEAAYHRTMDTRPGGGDSRSGRHLFGYLDQAGAQIVSAGASDWVVYPVEGEYPADEAYFLQFILHFFEESLGHLSELAGWLEKRQEQIEQGQLVYMAHQIDFLARVKPG
jgi:hypothetical protein